MAVVKWQTKKIIKTIFNIILSCYFYIFVYVLIFTKFIVVTINNIIIYVSILMDVCGSDICVYNLL